MSASERYPTSSFVIAAKTTGRVASAHCAGLTRGGIGPPSFAFFRNRLKILMLARSARCAAGPRLVVRNFAGRAAAIHIQHDLLDDCGCPFRLPLLGDCASCE